MRIKTVFSSNSQCCHVWAQQKQSEGRSSRIFFRDSKIFSYGEHYLAAKIHVVNYGKPFALVNSRKYSVSTSRHLSLIHDALRGKMSAFDVAKPEDIKAAIKELDGKAKSAHLAEMKRIKITSRDDIEYGLSRILGAYERANELRRLCGRNDIKVDAKTYAEAEKHLNNRLIRHQELNTPEALARKAVDRRKREAARRQKNLERLAEDIRRFRAGEIAGVDGLSRDLLRVQGDFVRTSRQVTVPLREAVVLFKALSNGHDIVGHKVGSFKVERVTDIANDKVIKIGCHRILLSEAKAVLKGLKTN